MITLWCIGYLFTVGLVGDYSARSLWFKCIGWPLELGDYVREKLK